MVWACTHNRYIHDDGIDAFNATFRSGWKDGLLKPLRGPRARYPDSEIIIDIEAITSRAQKKRDEAA
jgi:hypothetical protein